MTTSVACKVSYVTPPSGQYVSEPVNVIVGQKACDQVQATSSEMNLLEMTEVEYTHLQHLIQSHMEAQDGAEEVRLNPSSSADHESENDCMACQPGASCSSSSSSLLTQSVSSNQRADDRQEVFLYSDPSSISSLGESTPTGSAEIHSSFLAMKMRCVMEGARERSVSRRVFPLSLRPNPPARGDAQFSQQLEGSKQPEGITSKNLPVSKSADPVPRSPSIVYTDTTNEEKVINIENEFVGKAGKRVRTHRGRALQTRDTNIMQGSGNWKPVCIMGGRKPGRRTRPAVEIIQRKERHNLKERDRRRRIRLCCDELNTLVPFCYAETDKATTLQWTTAYLKYIREVYGDSLKQVPGLRQRRSLPYSVLYK
ncbi:hypothetical protein C0J45_13924 [Silurus meridionalis]|nr:hypothetical protein C0J45_13924 [Silurus meridionalis]